jgi:hypothetical protein
MDAPGNWPLPFPFTRSHATGTRPPDKSAPANADVFTPRQAVGQTGIDLKRWSVSEIAASVGSRSMLEAPKKPTTPLVRSRT